MRKLVVVLAVAVLASSWSFSAENEKQSAAPSSKQLAPQGNGGKDKIGGWLGFPGVGISYSHEFNDLIQLDLLLAGTFLFVYDDITLQAGALFTVFNPVINGQRCPLSIGPTLGGELNFNVIYLGTAKALSILLPIIAKCLLKRHQEPEKRSHKDEDSQQLFASKRSTCAQ